jgi:steroid delta-isomerase-like uncharacterized protein
MSPNETIGAVSRRRAVQVGGGVVALSALAFSGRASRVQAQEATPAATPGECVTTTPDENKAIAQRYFDIWASHDATQLSELLVPDYHHHWGVWNDTTGSDVMIERVAEFLDAFADLTHETTSAVAEGDLVVLRWTQTGTQTKPFQGIAATDTPTSWSGFTEFRIECGKIAEGWTEANHLGRLIELEVITPDELGTVGTPTP